VTAQVGFIVDLNRCTGCDACRLACAIENRLPPGSSWRSVVSFNDEHLAFLPSFHISLSCNHCRKPACLEGCPASAIVKDADTGLVRILPDRCLGCRYCSWLCPFDALHLGQAGIMEKCTFCAPRLAEQRSPACVTACPANALDFEMDRKEGPEDGPQSGFPRSRMVPAVRFLQLRRPIPLSGPATRSPERARDMRAVARAIPGMLPPSKILLRHEWSLVVFTLALPVLAAWLAASIIGTVALKPSAFIAAGAAAMLLSVSHLGRRSRAPRAIFNLKRSWLSREVLFFSAFFSLAVLFFFTRNGSAGVAALIGGFLAAVSVDALYMKIPQAIMGKEPRSTRVWDVDSASVTLTALYLTCVLAGLTTPLVLIAALKLLLHVRQRSGMPPVLRAARVLFGLIAPAFYALSGSFHLTSTMLLGVVGGEAVDRCRFYMDLRVLTPRMQSILDLRKMANERSE
jgi:Fe-S-cluster-containing dehydrogenase component